MTPLIVGLLSWGPTLIRTVGGLFGGKTTDAANQVADLVDAVKGLPTSQAEQSLAAGLARLAPETLLAFEQAKVRLAEIEKEREAARLAAETAQHVATQETARVEAQSDDEYVRRTRPGIARKSFYFTMVYALITAVLFPVLNAIYGLTLPAVQEWIVVALFGPCLSYIGARSVDAFSRKGKT